MTLLRSIAYARSGDKGNSANIGIIAYTPAGYEFLKNFLTAAKVSEFFHALQPDEVVRYEMPNLLAFNFVLKGVLGGGGSRSLRLDSQGKALGQALLQMPIVIESELLKQSEKRS